MATPSPEPGILNTTLLVLCGGAGRRMQGEDKPLLRWQDQPMVQHVIASVPAAMPKLISANRNTEIYRQWAPVVTDNEVMDVNEKFPGPLVGILGGLSVCKTPWLLVCPGDTPALPRNWCNLLLAGKEPAADGAVVHDGERQQHLHLLLDCRLRASLQRFLAEGGYQVFRWLELLKLSTIRINNPEAFRNINSPDEMY
ncbi:MAG: molybdenum cofactor guanylyltransferase [bacterium]